MKELAGFLGSQPTPSEERLLREAPLGNPIDFSDENGEKNDPKTAQDWGDARTIRARCIEWLLTDKQAQGQILRQGLRIRGARILESLALEYVNLPFPIEFRACVFDESIVLSQAHLKSLSLTSSHIRGIDARIIRVAGSVFLDDGFKAEGGVCLSGATIDGQLVCLGGEFHNPDGDALQAEGAEIADSVFLNDGFKAEGRVSFSGATIGGQLVCLGGEFHNPDGDALAVQSAQVTGDVLLRDGFTAKGRVSFAGATLGGLFNCLGGEFHNPDGDAIYAEGAKVAVSVFLNDGFKAKGRVSIAGASIGGPLVCFGGEFHNPKGVALLVQSTQVTGDVFLNDGFQARGVVSLAGATVGGQLVCSGGDFHNPDGDALLVQRAQVVGGVLLRDGFQAKGRVSMLSTAVGDQLVCSGGEFHNPEGMALLVQSTQVTGDVFLNDGFQARGIVSLAGTTVGGQLVCSGGEFNNPDDQALYAEGAKVAGSVFLNDGFNAEGRVSFAGATIKSKLVWGNVKVPRQTTMDLRGTCVGRLLDNADSWPLHGNLHLQGFRYDEIDDEAPSEASERIRWLRLQPKARFHPQPYEQLARVLFESGHEGAAKRIHVAKNDDRRRRGDMSPLIKPLHCLLKLITGYGYKPWRPMIVALILIGIGWGLFHAGGRENIIMSTSSERFAPTSEQQGELVHPNLHPLLYSLDVFLPVISFGHAEHWAPNENLTGHLLWFIPLSGFALHCYGLFLNLAGWVVTTLFITTLTGTISRRLG